MQKRILLILATIFTTLTSWGQGIITTEPAVLNADQQGKIIFTAAANCPLYNETGEVYAHIGVINEDGEWQDVQADWNENTDKCRMTKEGDHKWSITMSPTIREWFATDIAVTKIGLVVRNATGDKQTRPDMFINVAEDALFVSIEGIPSSGIVAPNTSIDITVSASKNANLTLDIIAPNDSKTSFTAENKLSLTKTYTFDKEGTYTINAQGVQGSEQHQTSATLTVRAAVTEAVRPAGTIEGINIINDNTATFVFFDSDKNGAYSDCVYWIGDVTNWKADNKYLMKRDNTNKCWWITVDGLEPGKEYAFQYMVIPKNGDAMRIADPYSTKVLDPWDDKYISDYIYPNLREFPEQTWDPVSVFTTTGSSYKWEVEDFKIENRDNLVIYELLIRDFTVTGSIAAAMTRLDYLQDLGVNAIELMPIQEFDGNISWGYNPCFFFALDKAYGTDDDYRRFIDECHKRGIAVLLDVVYNHATGRFPYCRMWWNSSTNKTTANNPWFNVDAPHPFSVFHDFNHECPEVRAFVKRNLQYLLTEYKIDGFRFDLTKGFTQRSCNESNAGNYDQSRINILKDYHAAIKDVNSSALMICEHFCDFNEEKALGQDGMMVWRKLNNEYCQAAMGYQSDSDFTGLYADGNSIPKNSYVGFMESHDEERTQYKAITWGINSIKEDLATRMDQAICNAALFLSVPGPKMIWQFGELGYDISGGNGDTEPKAPHWEYFDNPDRKRLYTAYAMLNTLRNSYPELFATDANFSWKASKNDWANGRYVTLSSKDGSKNVVIAANFSESNSNYTLNFAHTGTWQELLSKSQIDVSGTTYSHSMPAHSCVVYTDFTVTGVDDVKADDVAYTIYPNPATDYVYVNTNATLTVYNMSGSIVAQAYGNSINVENLPAGVYIINIYNNNNSTSTKFVKH